jgi:3',5'-cyclic AMP phosphodiesterase CpdA
VKYNNTLFIVLSTETAVGGDQRRWLEETLQDAQADSEVYWIVTMFHQPPFSTGMHGSNLSVREAWHALLRDYGVSLVLNGHEHSYEHVFVEGVHYLVMGGGGSVLRTFTSDPASWTIYRESVHHLAVFDVDGHELQATVLRRDGTEMESFVLVANQDGCQQAVQCWGMGHSECPGTWTCDNAQCTWMCD